MLILQDDCGNRLFCGSFLDEGIFIGRDGRGYLGERIFTVGGGRRYLSERIFAVGGGQEI